MKKHRCQRLDPDGKQCRCLTTEQRYYHGDDEIYRSYRDDDTTWVRVWLCDRHNHFYSQESK